MGAIASSNGASGRIQIGIWSGSAGGVACDDVGATLVDAGDAHGDGTADVGVSAGVGIGVGVGASDVNGLSITSVYTHIYTNTHTHTHTHVRLISGSPR